MTWEKFWSIIDRVRAKADMQDEASVKQFLYTELMKLPQDELLGFDCVSNTKWLSVSALLCAAFPQLAGKRYTICWKWT
jgi:hypothetical protein